MEACARPALSLRDYSYLLVPASVGLLIPMLVAPWVAVNFLGYRQYSLAEVMFMLFSQQPPPEGAAGQQIDLSILKQNGPTVMAAAASMALYIAAVAAAVLAAVPWKKRRTYLALAAGALAIGAGIAWIYALESLKDSISSAAAITGGIIGEEFRGREGELADLFIKTEIGPYVTMLAGAVAAAGFAADRLAARARPVQGA